jgi:putative transposase
VANTGISGFDIRDIMLEAVERRFKALRAPATIEMLTDNGPLYIAKDNPDLRPSARQPCFRPIRSPQSNGISEAFVKTLKRDYVQVTPLSDAQTVLES